MRIIIELSKLCFVDGLIEDICKKYKNKIKNIYRYKREILFNNGDEIKMISERQQIDGLRADVAIGPHAECFTCISKYEKRIWGFSDLENYLENL